MIEEQPSAEATRPLNAQLMRVLVENRREFLAFLTRRLNGRRDVAEDILQQAFSQGLDKLETLRDGEAVVPWFYRTLRNATVDYLRRTDVKDRALARFADEIEISEEAPETLRAEVCRCVMRIAETLKPEYANALKRIEVEGASIASFAEEQDISRNNAAVRVFRAREALRRQVAVSCGTCAEHGCFSCTCAETEAASDGGGTESV